MTRPEGHPVPGDADDKPRKKRKLRTANYAGYVMCRHRGQKLRPDGAPYQRCTLAVPMDIATLVPPGALFHPELHPDGILYRISLPSVEAPGAALPAWAVKTPEGPA